MFYTLLERSQVFVFLNYMKDLRANQKTAREKHEETAYETRARFEDRSPDRSLRQRRLQGFHDRFARGEVGLHNPVDRQEVGRWIIGAAV